jgi:outer membrane receptor protein involved in Fe transport
VTRGRRRPTAPWTGAALAAAALLAAAAPGLARAADDETSASPPAPEAPEPGDRAPVFALEEIVVTPTRTPRPLRDVPAAVTVLPRAEIERSPTKTTDELLRIVPSFGLFRRSSSVAADPSSQGVNLRGIGPSGVSRSLVLVDGIPANDPFGGWVYWRGIPRLGVQRVEVVPGGGSALYGNYALGGVTQVVSRAVTPLALDADAEAGAFDTWRLALHAADRRGPVGAAVEGELFRSGGYPVVADHDRGPIDGDTPSDHAALNARIEAHPSPHLALTLRGGWFEEDQNGGTRYTTAAVRRLGWSGEARWAPAGAGSLDLSVFGHAGRFEQQRARVSADRSSEALSAAQEVPTRDLGAGLRWTSRPMALAGRHVLTVGTDVRWIDGETREDLFPPTVTGETVVRREAGGEQRLYGVFAQDLYDLSPALAVTLAIRYDRWENVGATREETLGDGSSAEVEFPDRSDGALSPKAGVRLRPAGWLTLRAAAYRSFRAPTLNELYRPFQVGTVRTLANENLGPETLLGGEGGAEVEIAPGFAARVTGFWNDLADPVVNVTLDPGADPNLRQRQNLGRARIRGLEAEAGWRIGRTWLATASYTFVDSEVVEAPGQPQLLGKELPQDPRHRAAVALAFDDPRILAAAVQLRWLGRQYEDDLNTLPMEGVALLDVSASRSLGRGVTLFLSVENLLDEAYLVGRAGVDTVGQPRFVHGGIRLRLAR